MSYFTPVHSPTLSLTLHTVSVVTAQSNMEQFLSALSLMEKDITSELDNIAENDGLNTHVNDSIDSIRMRLSTGVTEVKAIVQNQKARSLNEITLDKENAFVRFEKAVLICLLGKVNNPRSTLASGYASVFWNEGHKLNIKIKNPLSVKTKESSDQLALLSFLNQAKELKITHASVVIENRSIQNLWENIDIYSVRNYKQGDSENDMPNKNVLQKIFQLKDATKIKLKFHSQPFHETNSEKLMSFMKSAKDFFRK